MKKLMMVAAMMLMSIGAFAQEGSMAVGAHLGYAGYGDGYSPFGLGAKFQYEFVENIRGELSADYWFPKNKVGIWDVNLNFHYTFAVGDGFKIYPLAGLTIVGWHGDETPSDTFFGFNLGFGGEYTFSSDLKGFAEFKYQRATKDINGFTWKIDGPAFNVGIAYVF